VVQIHSPRPPFSARSPSFLGFRLRGLRIRMLRSSTSPQASTVPPHTRLRVSKFIDMLRRNSGAGNAGAFACERIVGLQILTLREGIRTEPS